MRAKPTGPDSAEIVSPYLGLRPYTEEERHAFFGRDRERQLLVDKILANRLTLLFAASGVGKSSLLRAAVLPQLRDPERENLDAVYFSDWVGNPFDGLKAATLAELQRRDRIDERLSPGDIDADSLKDFFQFVTLFTRHPLVIVLDQFEEFFRYQRFGTQYVPFVRQLSEAIRDDETPIVVVMSMREDFALELNAFKPHLPTLLFGNYYRLEKLTVDGAREAIVEPAEALGVRYEPELLERILGDLSTREIRRGAGAALPEMLDTVEPPYLQIVCSRLWSLARQNGHDIIELATYRKAGGAAGLLGSYVASVVGDLNATEKRVASKCFDHLASSRGIKIAYTADELAEIVNMRPHVLKSVLQRLEQARILRSQSRDGTVWYELYHDLFTGSVSDWNNRFKSEQRRRHTLLTAAALSGVAFALYAAYDFGVNSRSYHLRLAPGDESEQVELHRGRVDSRDLFGLRGYVAETGYRREQLEPDKRFVTKPVASVAELDVELIENLSPLVRLRHYLDIGHLERARHLAGVYLAGSDTEHTDSVVEILQSFPSEWSIELLADQLRKGTRLDLQVSVAAALNRMESSVAQRALFDALERGEMEPEATVEALRALSRSDDPSVVSVVARALEHRDRSVRNEAAEALGGMRLPEALAKLKRLLGSDDAKMRERAAEILGRRGEPEAAALFVERLTRETDTNVRVALVTGLSAMDHPDSAPRLLQLVHEDGSSQVRVAAIKALGTLRRPSKKVQAALLGALGDDRTEVRDAAGGVLEERADVETVTTLVAALQERTSEAAAVEFASLLGTLSARLDVTSGVPALIERVRSGNPALRRAAIDALGKIGDARAVKVLASLLDSTDADLRKAAESALTTIPDASATAVFENALGYERRNVRLHYGQLLAARRDDPRAAKAVLELTGDPDEFFRSYFIKELAKVSYFRRLDPKLSVGVLTDMLEHPRWFARNNAMMMFHFAAQGGVRWNDLDAQVREAAIEAIARQLHDERPLDDGELLIDPHQIQRLRFNAIGALAALGDAYGVRRLLEFLSSGDLDPIWDNQMNNILKSVPASPVIARGLAAHLADMSPDYRRHTVELMDKWTAPHRDGKSQLLDANVVPHLLTHLNDSDARLRRSIVAILGRVGEKAADVADDLAARLEEEADAGVSTALIDALVELRAENAVDTLIRRLGDAHASVQAAAATALGELGAEQAVPHLVDKLGHRDPDVRVAVAVALAALQGPEALPSLRKLLEQSRDDKRRQTVVDALARSEDREAVEALISALGDPALRHQVAQALATSEAPEAVRALLNAGRLDLVRRPEQIQMLDGVTIEQTLIARLGNPDVGVRSSALRLLEPLREPRAVPELTKRLTDEDVLVRQLAVEALGRLRVQRAFGTLLQNLSSPTPGLQAAAARALGQFGDRRAVVSLTALLTGVTLPAEPRAAARRALGELGETRVVPIATGELAHADTRVRTAATEALATLCPATPGGCSDEVVETLLERLEDADSRVVIAAVRALGRIGDDTAVERLARLVLEPGALEGDKAETLHREIRDALVRLGGARATAALEQIDAKRADPADKSGSNVLANDVFPEVKCVVDDTQATRADEQVLGMSPAKLLELLDAPCKEVRHAAVRALGDRRVEDGLPQLHALLGEGDNAMRMEALDAIGEIAAPRSLESLEALLAEPDTPERIRLAALWAMDRIDPERVRQHALAMVAAQERPLGPIGYYLIQVAPEEALSSLLGRIDAASQNIAMRVAAAGDGADEEASVDTRQWLFELGYRAAVLKAEPGLKLLTHNLAEVRAGAGAGLGSSGDAELLERLLLLHEEVELPLYRSSVYRAVTRMLETIETLPSAVEPEQLERLQLERLERLQPPDEGAEEALDGIRERLDWTIAQLRSGR